MLKSFRTLFDIIMCQVSRKEAYFYRGDALVLHPYRVKAQGATHFPDYHLDDSSPYSYRFCLGGGSKWPRASRRPRGLPARGGPRASRNPFLEPPARLRRLPRLPVRGRGRPLHLRGGSLGRHVIGVSLLPG